MIERVFVYSNYTFYNMLKTESQGKMIEGMKPCPAINPRPPVKIVGLVSRSNTFINSQQWLKAKEHSVSRHWSSIEDNLRIEGINPCPAINSRPLVKIVGLVYRSNTFINPQQWLKAKEHSVSRHWSSIEDNLRIEGINPCPAINSRPLVKIVGLVYRSNTFINPQQWLKAKEHSVSRHWSSIEDILNTCHVFCGKILDIYSGRYLGRSR